MISCDVLQQWRCSDVGVDGHFTFRMMDGWERHTAEIPEFSRSPTHTHIALHCYVGARRFEVMLHIIGWKK